MTPPPGMPYSAGQDGDEGRVSENIQPPLGPALDSYETLDTQSFEPPEEFKEKNPLSHAPSTPMTAANTWMSLISDFVKTQLRSHGGCCSPPSTEQNLVPCSLLN